MTPAAPPSGGYDERTDRLYDLLGALFRSEDELQRFLVLEAFPVRSRGLSREKRSRAAGAYDTARSLVESGLADERLFAALARRAPQRAADIAMVAGLFTRTAEPPAPSAEPPAPSAEPATRPPAPVPPDTARPGAARPGTAPPGTAAPGTARPGTARPDTAPPDTAPPKQAVSPDAAFAARLRASFASLDAPDDAGLALSQERWPWAAAASVLGRFDPLTLSPLPGVPDPGWTALQALGDLVSIGHDGRWTLTDPARSACLRRLLAEDRLTAALEANTAADDPRRRLLALLRQGRVPPLARLDQRALVDLDTVLGWLEDLLDDLPVSRAAVHAAAERRLLIDPLRALVGSHFRGREAELARLTEHLGGRDHDELLTIRGAGGAGKSTLLGKALLQLEEQLARRPVSFAYLDFDRTRYDPRNPAGLLRQLAQQLRLVYATSQAAGVFAAVESAYGGTDLARAAELLDLTEGLAEDRLLDVLCERLRMVHAELAEPSAPPLILVLDTCEEVLAKGPGAVRDLNALLAALHRRLPGMRVVVAGRTVLPPYSAEATAGRLVLGDLDPKAADAVLAHRGVAEQRLRQLIVDTFGGNPLTLRLAAEALARTGSEEEAFADVVPQARAVAEVALEQVQGMLYSRILGHIKDPEVVAVAHPGLAVRRVTVDVLREVLAVPCRLDPARAEEIFGKLYAELSMFDQAEDGSLRHRQDVRRLMLRTMLDDPERAEVVADIHRRAIAFYAPAGDDVGRAEHLYHLLMSGTDTRSLDGLWDDALAPLLGAALEEPLPAAGMRWLERRLLTGDEEDRVEWEQEDWEANAHRRALSWLSSDDPRAALEVLAERAERLTPSRLYAVEVDARLRLGQLATAAVALERGLQGGRRSPDRTVALELTEQAVRLHARAADPPQVVEAALASAALADLVGKPRRAIGALAVAAEELGRLDADASRVTAELAARFRRLGRTAMLADPVLVRRVLHAAGARDASLLIHAALTVGDLTQDAARVFVDDAFVLARLFAEVGQSGQAALAKLAGEVGLSGDRPVGPRSVELAGLLLRTGRSGRAVALVLDHARDPAAAGRMVVDELVLPVEEQ